MLVITMWSSHLTSNDYGEKGATVSGLSHVLETRAAGEDGATTTGETGKACSEKESVFR